jgi:hypothetical protein
MATAVYCPLESAGLVLPDFQPEPVPVAVVVETTVPFAVTPAWICTLTGVVSLAVPVKDGVWLLDGDSGGFNVTLGAAVSTVNVTGALVPVSALRLVCVARTVYVSSARGSTGPRNHAPPKPINTVPNS